MPLLKILFPLRYPTMWDIRNRTLGEVMDLYVSDPRLKFMIGQSGFIRRHQRFHALHIRRRGLNRRHTGGHAFQLQPDTTDFQILTQSQAAHADVSRRGHHQRTILHQPQQRIAHRCDAGAHLIGQLTNFKAVARQ